MGALGIGLTPLKEGLNLSRPCPIQVYFTSSPQSFEGRLAREIGWIHMGLLDEAALNL